ncbi:Ig-like domain-containing protein [Acinetobacter gerneri]|uniref:Ig-like domain-containing protein n=3 Tax=Acinetobacter gerneri TaxID=202952 RepID=UPI001BB2ED72|nr:Ig-like domain-containing protein [Acinetobacter gerneri]
MDWQYQDDGLAHGHRYSYTVAVESAAGNPGAESTSYVIHIDSEAPSQTIQITAIIDNKDPVTGVIANGGVTNDDTPEIKGSLSAILGAGETVVVYRNGIEVGTATVTGTNWSFTDASLGSGESYSYSAEVRDLAGNVSDLSNLYSITTNFDGASQTTQILRIVDNVDPVTGVVPNNGASNDTTPTLEGSIGSALNAGDVVVIKRDGVEIGTATVTGTSWSFTDQLLADGSYTYTAVVRNNVGVEGAASGDYTITLDTQAPTASSSIIISYTDNVAPQEGEFASGSVTNDTSPSLNIIVTGSLAIGEVVAVYRDGVKIGYADLIGGDQYQFTDSALKDGRSYDYTTRVEDAAGNLGAQSDVFTVIIDTTAPNVLRIDSVIDDVEFITGELSPGDYTNDRHPTVNGSGAEAHALIILKDTNGQILGTTTADATGHWRVEPDTGNALTDGLHNLQVTQTDQAGNESPAVSFELNVDATAPTQSTTITGIEDDQAPVTGNVVHQGYTDDRTPTLKGSISATLGANEKVVILRDGVVIGEATVTGTDWNYTDSGLLDGTQYQYTARVEDSAGNRGGDSNGYIINIDSSVPTQSITIQSVTDNFGPVQGDLNSGATTDDSTPTLNGIISSALAANEVIVIYRDGVKVGQANISAGATNWSYTDGGLSNGNQYSYTARVEDASGLQGPVSNDFILQFETSGSLNNATITAIEDDQLPVLGTVQNNGYTNDISPLLLGRLDSSLAAGEKVAVYRDGIKIGEAIVNGMDWQYQDDGLAHGHRYSYTVAVESAAGNPGAESTSYVIHIDSEAPSQTIQITAIIDNKDPVTGVIANGGVTNDDTPEIKGSLSAILGAGETVVVYRNGIEVGTATVTGTNWSFTDASLGSGESYSYSAEVRDLAGNVSDLSNLYSITTNFDGASQTTQILRIVDNVDPVTGVVPNNGASNDTTPTLEGSIGSALNAGDVVVIKRDGVEIGTATVTGTSWSFTDQLLADGSYTYTAAVRNNVGVEGAASGDYTITLDTQAPTASSSIISYTDNVAPQEGEFASGSVTNDTSPSLNIIVTGSLAIGEVVAVYRDGVKIGYADLIGGDQYQFTDSALKDGRSYDYTTRVEDAAGNLGAQSDVFTLTVDLTAPSSNLVIEITSITDDTGYSDSDFITNDTSLTINGTLTGTLATDEFAQISIDAGLTWTTVDVIAGVWSYVDGRTLTDGTYTYHVRVVDTAGNVGSTSSQDVIIDITAPTQTAVITDYSDDVGQFQGNFLSGTKTDDLTPTLNGTLDLGLGYGEQLAIYQENNGTVTFLGYATVTGTTWRYDVNSNLQDGETYNFYAHVVDIAGNVGSQSNSLALTVDTTPPDVTNLVTTAEIDVDTANGVPLSGSTNTITATNKDLITRDASPELLSGSLSRELAVGEMLQISLDGGVTWRNVTTLTGQKYWEHTLNTVYQNDTTITVQLRVSDEAGNTAQLINQEKTITIDLTSPEGLDLAPIVDQLTDISKSYTFNSAVYGALEAGTTIALINDVNNNSMWQEGMDKVIATAVVASDGSWSITTTLPAGALNLGFILWDAAGNVSSMSNITSVGVASSVTGSEIIEATWGGTTDAEGYGLNAASVTISANGTWSFFQSVRGTTGSDTANAGRVYTQNGSLTDYTSAYLAQPSTSNGGDYNLTDWGYGRFVNSAMFADINRDGYVDVVSQISSYSNSGRTAYWLQNADGTWTPQVLDQGTLNHLGGAIAYDRTGDGYLDFVLADSEADSISFIKNNGGVLSYESNGSNGMPPSGAFTISNGLGTGSVTGNKMPIDLSVIHETGAVDLDNNGTVDVVAHVDYNGTLNYGNLGRGLGILYNSGTEAGFTYVNHANVFADDGHLDYGNLSQSVTFADFNGDGWLDMYLNRGAKNGVNSDESRIYLNNGKGQLNASDADAIWFGDNLKGGTSFAVDWNFDGLMDVIEVPAQIGGYITAAFAPTLYLNSGNGNWGQNPVALTPTIYGDVTGAVVVDYDWDGSLDLVLYHAGSDAGVVATDNSSPTTVIYNANVAADGTSLQIRILDGEGINTYYSNTVKLYDSKGNMVATQLINPQSSGSSNSMGLVSFYGLNANETYSVQLLRITNGVSDNVGGVANLGGYTNSTINTTWSGLTTGKAHDAYVLTAESSTAVNDSAKNSVGIVGTGYNDHFFGTLGNDHFNGGGGWIINSVGDKEWQANGGLDILDYSLLDAQISVDVSSGKVSKIVNGVVYQDTFENIEKFIAGSGDTVFTGGTSNDHFVGGQGNDTYNLGGVGGGSDTIYFALLNANNATGGNGSDVVNGFHVGSIATDIEADIIDLHEILDGYKGTPSLYTDSDGVKLDISSSDLLNFIDVSSDGTNTTISVDRDGTGQNFTTLITLNNVDTDLITLLMNNQLVI